MEKTCIFCKIINKQIPAKIVFEDDRVVAFEDIQPKAKTHILIVPKKHVEGLSGLTASDQAMAGELLTAVKDVAAQVKLKDYRLIVNNGSAAGQTVFHLHLHLLSPDSLF